MNMEHWAQAVRQDTDGTLRKFDFGTDCGGGHWRGKCNQRQYGGEARPPRYPLQDLSTPLALFAGACRCLLSVRSVHVDVGACRCLLSVRSVQVDVV